MNMAEQMKAKTSVPTYSSVLYLVHEPAYKSLAISVSTSREGEAQQGQAKAYPARLLCPSRLLWIVPKKLSMTKATRRQKNASVKQKATKKP